jgi:HAD superfamily hydrolase (TIGR01456 family)
VLGRYFPPIEAIILFGEPVRWETHLQLITDVLMSNGKVEEFNGIIKNPHIPVLACNTDFVWMSEASMPRFGHGTFLHCLEQLYAKLSNQVLKYSAIVGKPAEITYLYAENCLKQHAKALGFNSNIKRIYAIGDNIDTDIYGANVYNQILENNLISRQRKQLKAIEADDGSNTSEISFINEHLSMSDDIDCSAESCESILVCTGVYRSDVQSNNKLNYGHRDMIVDETLKTPKYICNDVYDAVNLVLNMENS